MSLYLRVGGKCVVNVPKEDKENYAILGKFNGMNMVITKKVQFSKGQGPYFELDEAKGNNGVPYGFLRDWLIPCEVKNE